MHNVFISFYHQSDQIYKDILLSQLAGRVFKDVSVDTGDINTNNATDTIRSTIRDSFIASATVSLVLVGNGTWRRKHVDWEIGSSIRDTKRNSRTGLVGVLTPSYRAVGKPGEKICYTNDGGGVYYPSSIPPRLWDNVKCGYAKIYSWTAFTNSFLAPGYLEEAYKVRYRVEPDNSYPPFVRNRNDLLPNW